MTHQIAPGEFFKWQGGYGAFTLRNSEVPKVELCIKKQKEHHAEGAIWKAWEQTLNPNSGQADLQVMTA